LAERLPNGHRTVAGAERIALWAAVIALILGGLYSYTQTTSGLKEDLDRNCRILVRIDNSGEALLLVHAEGNSDLIDELRRAQSSAPTEICG
jgi:hypothetical protein